METIYDAAHLISALRSSGGRWREVLSVPDLSVGLYRLEKGAEDPQVPHGEDEIYYVLAGRAWLRVGDDDQEVRPGSIAYVPARAAHLFHDITEDLELLVLFAPAEGSRG
jgi:quercetin dioxygenase-like cupin family protein